MDRAVVEQLLDEMLSSLEDLETKATATLQFLRDKGHATDQDLAPYLEQAGNASNVRWRAARLRMMSLLSSALKSSEAPKEENKVPPRDSKIPDAQKTEQPSALATAGKPAELQREEERRPVAQATKAQPSGDKQSADAGKKPEPNSPELKDTQQRHPAAEAKAAPNEAQPDAATTQSAPPPENSDLTRKADRPASTKTKEDAA